MNVEDLDKLKVADLRKELKSRGLSYAGNKPELVTRLTEAITAVEKQILDTTVASDLPDEAGLLASEADILGIASTVEKDSEENISVKPVSTHIPVTALKENETKTKDSEKIETCEVTDNQQTKIVQSEEEKRIARAHKFNIQSQNIEDKKKLRAERFGLPAVENPTSTKLSKDGSEKDPEALKKRAERFGIPNPAAATSEDEKKALRAAKFNTSQAAVTVGSIKLVGKDEEQVRKRKERFGDCLANEDTTEITNGKTTNSVDEAKKKRAARFAL